MRSPGRIDLGILNHFGSFGSVVFRFNGLDSGNLFAATIVRREGHPIDFHFDADESGPGYSTGGIEGLWWLPAQSSTDYLILSNPSPKTVTGFLALSRLSRTNRAVPISIGSNQTKRIDLRELLGPSANGGMGGLSLILPGKESLSATQIVFDEVTGGTANGFIFVGTDTHILSANTYFLPLASGTPTGGTDGGSSSDTKDSLALTWQSSLNLEKATIQTSDQSANAGDRTLTFTYTPPSCQAFTLTQNVTARQFAYLTNNTPTNQCTLGYGTDRYYTYVVYTHPDKTAVDQNSGLSSTPVTESFNPTLQCNTVTGSGSLNANGQFTDHITSVCSSQPLTCTQTTTRSLSVAGVQVRTNTLSWTSTGVTYTSDGPTQ